MTPEIKLALAAALVAIAVAVSLIGFPIYSDRVEDLQATEVARTPSVTP